MKSLIVLCAALLVGCLYVSTVNADRTVTYSRAVSAGGSDGGAVTSRTRVRNEREKRVRGGCDGTVSYAAQPDRVRTVVRSH